MKKDHSISQARRRFITNKAIAQRNSDVAQMATTMQQQWGITRTDALHRADKALPHAPHIL